MASTADQPRNYVLRLTEMVINEFTRAPYGHVLAQYVIQARFERIVGAEYRARAKAAVNSIGGRPPVSEPRSGRSKSVRQRRRRELVVSQVGLLAHQIPQRARYRGARNRCSDHPSATTFTEILSLLFGRILQIVLRAGCPLAGSAYSRILIPCLA